ncbi:Xaa-Pro aminopeptidase [Sphingobium sp. JAI105]|uniref:M24 family metallopeptidase n=1 Tax=Sphingobium sp. JAI105 TaxID=2787715 RepID=UPI0018CBBC67|nr:M24 family metallopeptidase [Sphingobium sp. JAI105]MBG6118490.1 Xaa-Pro aminopeptidase [Sphingobium sp. JAI105]
MEHVKSDLSEYRREKELTLGERDARWARVRLAMAQAGIDVLVTPPNPGFWDQLQANATFLSTVGGNNAPVSVVFPKVGKITAVVGPVPSAEFWLAWQSWVTDVRETPWSVGEGVIGRLRELGFAGARIGIPGLKGTVRFPEGLATTGFIDRISQAFPDAAIVDATDLLDQLRADKTAEERAAVADAVALTEEAFELLLREAKAGVPERVLYGKMVGHLIARGALPTNFLMWSAGGGFRFSLAPFPTARPLRQGDIIHCEIEARGTSGYLGQISRTVSLGAPGDAMKAMFDLAVETFASVMASMKPGATIGDILAVYKERNAQTSFRVVPVIHTRALGEDRPMIVFGTQDPAILQFEIQQHHIYALKVQVRDESTGEMGFWGESVAIGSEGAARLGAGPLELSIIK